MIVMVPIRPTLPTSEVQVTPAPIEPKKNFPLSTKMKQGTTSTAVTPAPIEKLVVVGEFSAFKVLIDDNKSIKLKFVSQRYVRFYP